MRSLLRLPATVWLTAFVFVHCCSLNHLRCLRRSGMAKGYDNRLCCNIDACSITDYKACMSQREADRLALLQGRRLEADVEAEQNTLERLRNELRTQELGQK